jgi:hypothetical protein
LLGSVDTTDGATAGAIDGATDGAIGLTPERWAVRPR